MIRPYQPKDFENLRYICWKTATAPQYVKDKELVAVLYVDYYAIEEPEHVFVCTDDNDNAVGYILCAVDYDKFRAVYMPKYVNKIKKQYPFEWIAKKIEPLWMKNVHGDYPAHLHIDILPEHQKGGNGRKLIQALENHLREIGVKGLCLGCGADNKNAHGFYEHLGFEKIKNVFGTEYIYAKHL